MNYILPRMALVLGLGLAVSAMARQSVDETRPANKDVRISVDNVAGSIVVAGWDQPEMQITGSLAGGVEKLEIKGDASGWDIEVKYPRGKRNHGSAQLTLHVPHGADLDVDSVSADIDIQDINGVSIQSESVSGTTKVRASPEHLAIETVSGDIDTVTQSAHCEFESVSGDIAVSGASGDVSMSTVSGDAELSAGEVSRGKFETVSGNLTLKVELQSDANLTIESMSGDVDLTFPKSVSARMEVETFSGDVNTPFGETHEKRYGPGKSWRYTAGKGSGRIKINSFSGDVSLKQD